MGKLYVIATPVGNRSDITLRALETIRELHHFVCEDTREFLKLLTLYEIDASGKKTHSFTVKNFRHTIERTLETLKNFDVGLTCDRGTPAISDPGAVIVRRARESGFEVTPLPGPSTVTALFSVSGFESRSFMSLGFIPKLASERGLFFSNLLSSQYPACFFESPNRIRRTILELSSIIPDRKICIGREISKKFEQFWWGPLGEIAPEKLPEAGEYAGAVEGCDSLKPRAPLDDLENDIQLRLATDKEWSKSLSKKYETSAKELYNRLMSAKRSLPKNL